MYETLTKIKSYFPLRIKIINYRDYQNYAKWCKSDFDKLCKNTWFGTYNNNLSHFNNSINTVKLLINLHKYKNVITCMWDRALMQQCITTQDGKPLGRQQWYGSVQNNNKTPYNMPIHYFIQFTMMKMFISRTTEEIHTKSWNSLKYKLI